MGGSGTSPAFSAAYGADLIGAALMAIVTATLLRRTSLVQMSTGAIIGHAISVRVEKIPIQTFIK